MRAKLHVDASLEDKSDALENRRQIADELAEQRLANRHRPDHRLLTILTQRLQDPTSQWQTLLQDAFTARGLVVSDDVTLTDVHQMHWHAGRGVNANRGADVYALMPPTLSAMNAHYNLAALLPDDPLARAKLQVYALAAECMQMLHRGRQPDFPAGSKPRIVVGFSEEKLSKLLEPLADRVTTRPYKPLMHFTRQSQNPRWRDMTAALARELLAHPAFKDGLPRRLLTGLPKHLDRDEKVYDRLKDLALTTSPASHLHRAFHDPENWTYAGVKPGGKGNDSKLLDDAMAQLGLTKEKLTDRQGQPVVYVPAGSSAAAAQRGFDNWLFPPEPWDWSDLEA